MMDDRFSETIIKAAMILSTGIVIASILVIAIPIYFSPFQTCMRETKAEHCLRLHYRSGGVRK